MRDIDLLKITAFTLILSVAIITIVGSISIIKIVFFNDKENYIQNLEEKLNIYERSYEEFCLEDSIRQVE